MTKCKLSGEKKGGMGKNQLNEERLALHRVKKTSQSPHLADWAKDTLKIMSPGILVEIAYSI